jgi:hypothetical protein
MRTTVRLNEDLLSEVKQVAAAERTTLTAILEQSLRELLARRRERREGARVSLPTFKGRDYSLGLIWMTYPPSST